MGTQASAGAGGGIKKCPSCGGGLKAFASVCELCGHELSEIQANKTVSYLVGKFEEIEDELKKTGLTGTALEKEIAKRRARVIRDFPVPNAREDLQSLVYFIYPKIEYNVKPDPNAEDWRVKFKEVITLAKNAYRGDAATRVQFEKLEKNLDTSLSSVIQTRARRNPFWVIALAGVAVLFVVGAGASQYSGWKADQCKQEYQKGAVTVREKLVALAANTESLLNQKQFSAAYAELSKLRWDYQLACAAEDIAKDAAEWDAKRQAITEQIQRAEVEIQTKQQAQAKEDAAKQQAEFKQQESAKQAIRAAEHVKRQAQEDQEMDDALSRQAKAAAKRGGL